MTLDIFEDPEIAGLIGTYMEAANECAERKGNFDTCVYCHGDKECKAYHSNKEEAEHTCSDFICFNENGKFWGAAVKWMEGVFMPLIDTNGDGGVDFAEIESVFDHLVEGLDQE